ncbi:hypothetical protein EV421DRAFT_2025201 [Armillaria borealis]|uniref:Uncharacterized protein n=1 Tax=Armillaria borealis TaxID=47425 RepID=A0AA39IUX7_9AGAR|nr:hypothetical protein EV421DRAFT_2025201 [Armillaria borealis]
MFFKIFELESCGSMQEGSKINDGTVLHTETGGCHMIRYDFERRPDIHHRSGSWFEESGATKTVSDDLSVTLDEFRNFVVIVGTTTNERSRHVDYHLADEEPEIAIKPIENKQDAMDILTWTYLDGLKLEGEILTVTVMMPWRVFWSCITRAGSSHEKGKAAVMRYLAAQGFLSLGLVTLPRPKKNRTVKPARHHRGISSLKLERDIKIE